MVRIEASSALVPIIVAIIGTSGVLGVALLPGVIPFFNKPFIDVSINETSDALNTFDIFIINSGASAATNTSITIVSPSNVTSTKPKLVPVKLDSISYEENIIQFNIPRLVPGEGSMITIETTIANSTNSGKEGFFTSYAVYDQGSVKIITQKDGTPIRFEPYWSSSWFIILLVATLAAEIVGFSFLFRRPPLKKVLGKLSDSILEIRTKLKSEPEYDGEFENYWEEIPDFQRRALFEDMKEYLAADDFFTTLVESRNQKIKCSNLDKRLEVVVLNHKLLASADDILRNVKSPLKTISRWRLP